MRTPELFYTEQDAGESIKRDTETEVGTITIERNGAWRGRLNGECDTSSEACLVHGAEHRTGEDAAAERSWAHEARRPAFPGSGPMSVGTREFCGRPRSSRPVGAARCGRRVVVLLTAL